MSFPAFYPDAPAVVRPRNLQGRISTHQYGGANGPLCLEWGPDNWHREVTAVQMLESAYRLFATENPLGENRPEVPVVAPSRHKLTVGQELRSEWARWYASGRLEDYFASQPNKSVGSFKFSFRKAGENWTCLVHEAMPLGGNIWKDDRIPASLPGAEGGDLDIGVWFKTDLNREAIGRVSSLAELQSLLADLDGPAFLATDGTSPVEGFQRPLAGVLIVDRTGGMNLFVVLSGKSLVPCSKVQSESTPVEVRSPECHELQTKRIGIVGLGSVGSKIAISLTRMGVPKLFLADHDVLLPENLQRHALDWIGVLQHKVDSMTLALGRITARAFDG